MAKLLIVEDDEILYKMYQKMFQNHGYDVQVATDGEAGLKVALEEHPDLILLDINMPKMDGLSVMHTLRENSWGKSVPIILLTNLEASDDRLINIVKDQPAYYLIKSNNPPEMVLEKINEILDNRKMGG